MSKVRNTGYLDEGYASFNTLDNGSLKLRFDEDNLAELNQTVGAGQPLLFVVNQPEWLAAGGYSNPEKQEAIVFTVRERMYRYLLRNYPHPVRVRYAYTASDAETSDCRVVYLNSAITDCKKGNGFSRYVFGWGAGEGRLQLEGSFVDGSSETATKLGDFVVRRGNGGYAQNGINVNVLKSDYALRYAADEAIALLTETLPRFVTVPVDQVEKARDQYLAQTP